MSTEETGPTGPTGTNEQPGTFPIMPVDPTGPIPYSFPSATTVTVEDPQIVTLEELMQSHAVVLAKQEADKQALTGLTNPLREQYRPQLFQWAGIGFPSTFIVQSFEITPPNVCSDGVTRDPMAYLQFLLSPTTFDEVLDKIRTLMPGILVSFSFAGSTLRIHVSKN
jgi:hypothetical protein